MPSNFKIARVARNSSDQAHFGSIFHQRDATLRGHLFRSFLALLMDELKRRLVEWSLKLEWDLIRQDLEALQQVEVREGG